MEPPLLSGPERPPGANRVAIGLAVFGLWDLVSAIIGVILIDFESEFNINLGSFLTFALYWIAAWLVWKNQRFVWVVMTYLTATAIGAAIGLLIGAVTGLPSRLISAALHANSDWTPLTFSTLSLSITLAFMIWLLVECLRVLRERRPLRNVPKLLQPFAVGSYSAILHGLIVALVLALMQGSWTAEPISRARSAMTNADDYEYFVTNYQSHTFNGKGRYRAVVLAYNDQGFEPITLSWEN